MAADLVNRGHPLDGLRTLADLVAVENAKEILRARVGNRPDEVSAFTRGLATSLLHIARHWVRVPTEHLERLRDLNRRLGPARTGLTEKNRTTLRQFDDLKTLQQLLLLPRRLMAKARRLGPGNRRAAVLAQLAIAMEILQSIAIRMNNLVGLRMGEHLARPGGPKTPYHLVLPAEETKNGEPTEFSLSAECSTMIDIYRRDFRPAVAGPADPWLFNSGPGKAKGQSTLAQQLRRIIWQEAGIRMSPHQFRHLTAKILLMNNPGNLETARQLLGHKNSRTTTNFYSGMQSGLAAIHYDRILQGYRQSPVAFQPVRPKRRP
jgi:integrase